MTHHVARYCSIGVRSRIIRWLTCATTSALFRRRRFFSATQFARISPSEWKTPRMSKSAKLHRAPASRKILKLSRKLQHDRWRAWNHAFRWAKAAYGDSACAPPESANSHPRRRTLERRYLHRGTHSRSPEKGHGRSHDDLHLPPGFNGTQC